MSERDLELFARGVQERRKYGENLMALQTANIVNVQLERGKKVKIHQVGGHKPEETTGEVITNPEIRYLERLIEEREGSRDKDEIYESFRFEQRIREIRATVVMEREAEKAERAAEALRQRQEEIRLSECGGDRED